MKRILLVASILSAILFANPVAANADNKDADKQQKREEMAAKRFAKIVDQLNLSDETAAKFKPIYENYKKEMRQVMGDPKQRERKNPAEETEAEVEAQIKSHFAKARTVIDIREKYYNEFRKVLSPKQIRKFYRVEAKFREHGKFGKGEGMCNGKKCGKEGRNPWGKGRHNMHPGAMPNNSGDRK